MEQFMRDQTYYEHQVTMAQEGRHKILREIKQGLTQKDVEYEGSDIEEAGSDKENRGDA